jgi:hypothetical protein
MAFATKNHTCLLQKKLAYTTSNKNHERTCPWWTRSHWFGIFDHKFGSPEPIGAGEDGNEPIPLVSHLPVLKKALDLKLLHGHGCAWDVRELWRRQAGHWRSSSRATVLSPWRATSPALGKAESPCRHLHHFQLLNDRPKSKNIALLQFQTDNVALRWALDAYRSHDAEGNRSRGRDRWADGKRFP